MAILAFGISWLVLVAMGVRTTRGTVTMRTEFDAEGSTVHPDHVVGQLSRLMLAAGVLATIMFAVLAPTGRLAIPIPNVQRFALPGVAAITGLVGAVMLWRTIRQGSLSYLRLTPSGFEFGGGLSTKRGEWSAVTAVTTSQPGARNLTASAIVVTMSDRATRTVASTGSYTSDANALRDMVQYYWQHPGESSEL